MEKLGWCLLLLIFHNVESHDVGLSAEDFRLPTALIPEHYFLQLQPILDETPGYTRFTAPGKINISFACQESTSIITLNSLDINITEDATLITDQNGNTIPILETRLQPELQFFTVVLSENLERGSMYQIYIEFVTPVSQTRLDGMYLDQYVDPATNETKYVATTLFAAISARRSFPCFDEPHLKAEFDISLVRKEGYHSLSNRHLISTEPMNGMNGWFIDKFATSMPMATYLVAMIVSDMTYEEAVLPPRATNNDTTIRVYAPYYLINRGGGVYAANQTNTVLSKFETYFNSKYMLAKLDSVSLPRFFFSAMENWGLITYNDRVLLYFPGETTESERYRITSIIAHEVGHHFFGNLVTCKWWTWIWLNEGSATYFSHLGVEMTYPEFNPWDRFVSDVYQVAMEYDSSSDTHPVANEPTSIADIGKIYDDIAYEKGASLLRMLQSFLTEEVMQAAIQNYLQDNQFKNVEQDELFAALQNSAEELGKILPATVNEIMDPWTQLSGFPLLHVSRINSTSILITQEKFQAEPTNETNTDLWWVPVKVQVVFPTSKEYFFWMSKEENQIVVNIPESEVFIVNPKSEGFYRTLYSPEILHSILQHNVNSCYTDAHAQLSSISKAKLIDDYISFERFGMTDVRIVSSGTLCIHDESLIFWDTLLKHYTRSLLESKIQATAVEIRKSLKKDLLPSINHHLTELTARRTSELNGEKAMLLTELTFWMCFIDPTQYECNDFVTAEMEKWIIQGNISASPFAVDVEETYLCMAASQSKEFSEKILEYMNTKISSSSKARIANALMCSKQEMILRRVMESNPEMALFMENLSRNGLKHVFRNRIEASPYLRTYLRLQLDHKKMNFVLSTKIRN